MKIRPEIQGLRAIAVLLVIFGHAFPQVFSRGFVGVDIFFVISGYVITQMLIRNINQPFGEYLADFYSKRARRILPSALLVIILTISVTYRFLGSITGGDTAKDGIWAVLFLANFHFSSQAVDYFASAIPLPILQHYWSLSIEEQFYIVWPALFFFASRWLKKPKHVTFLLVISSLSLSIINGGAGSPSSYFSTPSRIWELGGGCLLALYSITKPQNKVAISSVFAMVALGIWRDLMSATIAQITAVVLTLLFLSCADSNCPLISGKTLVYLGNISYLLYLVHWPMLQIPRLYVGLPLSGLTISILLLFTLMLAALIHKIFESPIRYMPSLVNSLRKTAIAMTTSIVFTLTLLRMVQ